MAQFTKDRFSSITEERETPDSVFFPLNEEFNFETDVAATKTNTKCITFFDKKADGLKQSWRGTCWMNPPFGRQIKSWVKKAYESSLNGATVVCLLPARTNTVWWHNYCMRGEVRFIKGRPKFKGQKYGLPFPLAIVVFRGKPNGVDKRAVRYARNEAFNKGE